ncbi:MAG: class I SAM-dependent methyltransferase [Verrucomicrobia bacterium]|nr:class I SAM-dependent methyltransferase [Verrucomicrobiota bacterium]
MREDRASATAEVIAASTLLLATDPTTAPLVAPGACALCEALLGDSARGRFLRGSIQCAWMRPVWHAIERMTHPGITRHYWLRKRWIEARVRTGLASGVRRVLVLGAGLDTLALRLAPSFPDVAWVEVDHPATQTAKRRALLKAGIPVPPTVRFVAADLAKNSHWPGEVGTEPGPVMVVLEGLLMYFSRDEVESLLVDRLPALAGGPMTVVFSYMVQWPQGRAGFRPSSRLVDTWLALKREPFRWLQPPELLPQWIASLGYSIVAHACPPFDIAPEQTSPSSAVLQGENLVEAVRMAQGADSADKQS